MTEPPPPVLAVVAQLYNVFCAGRYDAFDRLVDGRGLSGDELAGALRSAGIYTWQRLPQEAWYGDDVDASENDDGSWIVEAPVWSEGEPADARLRLRVEDPFGDGLWEPWVEAVET